jgi:uncharacterized protein (DUF885 family)
MRKRILHFILILTLLLSFAGLLKGSSSLNTQVQSRFDSLLNNLFTADVQMDTITLNYTLAKPENYGITDTEPTLGEYSLNRMNYELSRINNYHNRLSSLDCKLLTPDQQLSYHIIKAYLEVEKDLGPFTYYSECLGPTTGIQAELPILLAEFNFNDKDDIEKYLKLLPCVYDYFEDIAQFEREKSEHGLFMSDEVANRIIEQCRTFIKNPGDNFLIDYFNDKISLFEGLSASEINHYEALNKEAVLNKVIPAYELLADELTKLLGTGTNNAGLCYFPDGKAFYDAIPELDGDRVILKNDLIESPLYVRYAWKDYAKPMVCLYNKDNMPADSFLVEIKK